MIARAPERPNLLATLDFGPGGRHLVLCGHIDTKPVGGAHWSVEPFSATVDGDRLYGLGSTDMKGAVAAMIVAARDLDLPRGRLSLLLVRRRGERRGLRRPPRRRPRSRPTRS